MLNENNAFHILIGTGIGVIAGQYAGQPWGAKGAIIGAVIGGAAGWWAGSIFAPKPEKQNWVERSTNKPEIAGKEMSRAT